MRNAFRIRVSDRREGNKSIATSIAAYRRAFVEEESKGRWRIFANFSDAGENVVVIYAIGMDKLDHQAWFTDG